MKKILAVALALLMIVPMLTFSGFAAAVTADTSWYDASATEYRIGSAEKLLGLAALSESGITFKDKLIRLDADITLNEGQASAWATSAPAISWTPLSNFAGTIDGQGHAISGLYSVKGSNAGFIGTADGATVKELSILNSYFATTSGNMAASFIAWGATSATLTLEKCYSNAIVSSALYNAGGLVCSVGNALVTNVSECWFDGTVTLTVRYGAGIVANGEGKEVNVKHCLNTGSVYTSHLAEHPSHIAGIVGRNDGFTNIEDCFNAGRIHSAKQASGITDAFGAIFGANSQTDATKGGLSILNSWATTESCDAGLIGTTGPKENFVNTDANGASTEALMGYGAYSLTNLDFEHYWAVDLDGTPMLMYFADEIPTLYKVDNPEIVDYELKTEGNYGPRWYVKVAIPEGMTAENVKIGMLVVPSKALPTDHKLTLFDTSFTYRGNEYEVANVEGKILRESEEGTLLASFVITDLGAETARTQFTVRPYAIFTIDEAELKTYGETDTAVFYKEAVLTSKDEATDDERKAQLDAILAPIYEGLGGEFPVMEEWSNLEEFVEVPAYKPEGTSIIPVVNYGPEYECFGSPTNVLTLDMALDAHYYEYRQMLETYGFELVTDNGETGLNDSVYTAIYKKGDLVVTVTMLSYMNQLAISATFDMPLSEHLFDNFADEAVEGAKDSLSMLEMIQWGNSYVMQLKNGHFIINDGAGDREFPYLMQYLQKLAGEGNPVIIEAWFVTHAHYDHYCVIRGLYDHPELIPENFYVEGFYINFGSAELNAYDKGVYNEMGGINDAIRSVKTTKGETPKVYRPMTGQKYYFCDMVVEIPLSQEQVPIEEYYERHFNESSTWYKYNFNIGDGKYQSFLVGGDADRGSMKRMMMCYDPEYLESDIFSVLHHLYNTWDEFTNYMDYKTLFVPQREKAASAANTNLFNKALDNGGEVFWEGNGNVFLTFPYEVGQATQTHEFKWEYAHLYGYTDGEKTPGA